MRSGKPARHRLKGSVIPRDALTVVERERMLALMELCYEGVQRARFFADLDAKDHVIVLKDAAGEIQGFSTLRLFDDVVDGRRVEVLFSGDTVIHPDMWGAKALQRTWIRFAVLRRLSHPTKRLYWLLLSKGYRTYMLLANNFPTSFPRRDSEDPPALVSLRDRIAAGLWGPAYDPARAILHFADERDRVRAGLAPIEGDALEHPDVRFFVERNPGYARGDELVCLAEIDALLPIRYALRSLVRARRPLTRARKAEA